jgi:NADH dehydrogenase
VAHSQALFAAAARAGVQRIVHVSITNADAESKWSYFRGKAEVERLLAEAGVAYSVIRPTVVFGAQDVLVNNIAWLLRRFPVFAIAGRGDYRVRPVFVDDLARLCVENALTAGNQVVNAVGPDILTFEEMVRVVRDAVGSQARLVHLPPATLPALASLIGIVVRDVLVTREELGGLMDELVMVAGPTTGSVSFREWVGANAEILGRTYASELGRHFRRPSV